MFLYGLLLSLWCFSCKVLFSGFLQFNGNFVNGQNNPKIPWLSPFKSWFLLYMLNLIYKPLAEIALYCWCNPIDTTKFSCTILLSGIPWKIWQVTFLGVNMSIQVSTCMYTKKYTNQVTSGIFHHIQVPWESIAFKTTFHHARENKEANTVNVAWWEGFV